MQAYPGLNVDQEKAIYTESKQVIVRAGPGVGKTRVISFRILHLLQNLQVPPNRIYAVTFSHKAAKEMRERVHDLVERYLGDDHPLLRAGRRNSLQISTFHALGLRILRDSGSACRILSEQQKRSMIAKLLCADQDSDEQENPAEIMTRISNLKNRGILPCELELIKDADLARIYREYEDYKNTEEVVDFDDLILKSFHLLQKDISLRDRFSSNVRYLLVDEYQDTNSVQYFLSRQLCHIHQRIFVVGDPDQCIFSFRDANRANIYLLKRDFPKAEEIVLTQNYRSTQVILDCAIKLMEKSKPPEKRTLRSNIGQGNPIVVKECLDENMEGEFIAGEIRSLMREGIALDDITILCRTNYQFKPYEEVLSKHGIHYRVNNTIGFYQQREVQELADMLRFVLHPHDTDLFLKTLRVSFVSIFSETIEDIISSFDRWKEEGSGALEQENLNLIYFLQNHVLVRDSSHFHDGTMDHEDKNMLETFTSVFHDVLQRYQRNEHVGAILSQLLQGMNIRQIFEQRPNAQKRIDCVNGLLDFAREIDQRDCSSFLEEFLTDLGTIEEADSTNATDSCIPAVIMTTLHGSKGLEWPIVFIPGVEERRLPFYKAQEPKEIEEERRLFYVGITRAKHRLFMTKALFRKHGDELILSEESRFLTFLRNKLKSSHLTHSRLHTAMSKSQRQQLEDLLERSGHLEKGRVQTIVAELSQQLSLAFINRQDDETIDDDNDADAGGDPARKNAIPNLFITASSMMDNCHCVASLPDTQFIDQLNEISQSEIHGDYEATDDTSVEHVKGKRERARNDRGNGHVDDLIYANDEHVKTKKFRLLI